MATHSNGISSGGTAAASLAFSALTNRRPWLAVRQLPPKHASPRARSPPRRPRSRSMKPKCACRTKTIRPPSVAGEPSRHNAGSRRRRGEDGGLGPGRIRLRPVAVTRPPASCLPSDRQSRPRRLPPIPLRFVSGYPAPPAVTQRSPMSSARWPLHRPPWITGSSSNRNTKKKKKKKQKTNKNKKKKKKRKTKKKNKNNRNCLVFWGGGVVVVGGLGVFLV